MITVVVVLLSEIPYELCYKYVQPSFPESLPSQQSMLWISVWLWGLYRGTQTQLWTKKFSFCRVLFLFLPSVRTSRISASNNQQRQPDWVLCIPQENKQMKPLFEGHTLLFLRHKKGAIFSVLLLIDHSEFDSKRFQWYCCVIINSRYV